MHSSASVQFGLPRSGPDSASGFETAPMAGFNATESVFATSPTVIPSPATKPKRPLSAYNLFFQFERKKILVSAPPGAPEIGFKDMARVIAKRWKRVDLDYKMELTSMANKNKMRYNMAMRSYRKQLADEVEELQRQEEEKEFDQTGSPSRVLMPAFMPNGNKLRFDTAMRTYRKQLADEAELMQRQGEIKQAKCFSLISQVTPLGEKAYKSSVDDDMLKQPPIWDRTMHNYDVTTPTSILQDSSVASLAQHLDDEMTQTIISIFL